MPETSHPVRRSAIASDLAALHRSAVAKGLAALHLIAVANGLAALNADLTGRALKDAVGRNFIGVSGGLLYAHRDLLVVLSESNVVGIELLRLLALVHYCDKCSHRQAGGSLKVYPSTPGNRRTAFQLLESTP